MKIKYRMPDSKHDTCFIVGDLTGQEFEKILKFLAYHGVEDYEYIHKG